MPDEKLGEKTCIYIVVRPGKTVQLENIVSLLKETGMATYKLPERINPMPLTKIQLDDRPG